MNNLVQLENNRAFTTTLIIAEGVNLEHRAVMQLLKTYKNRPTFASLEMTQKKTKRRPLEYAELTELQATFLITLMKNSSIVVEFKEKLSVGFFKMRHMLDTQAMQRTNEQWLETRATGKIARLEQTDEIKKFIDYAIGQGSKNASRYYKLLTDMENKALFILEQKYKNIRDILPINDLTALSVADELVRKVLKEEVSKGTYYKEIYVIAKERIDMFAELRGKSPVEGLLSAQSH